jgi:hypothetical protein
MPKITIVTMIRLNRALSRVVRELEHHGLWDEKLQEVDVYLVPVGLCYGWQMYRSSGEICVPAVSFTRVHDWISGDYVSLADLLRHEYGHALADTHRGLIRSREFRRAFGTHHNDADEWEYDPQLHVSAYAASCAAEDFAETFMLFLRYNGKLPTWHSTPAIRAKWRFIRRLCGRVACAARK